MQKILTINHLFSAKGKSLAWPLLFFFLLEITQSTILNKTTIVLFILYLVIANHKEIINISVRGFKAYGLLLLLAWDILSISWSSAPSASFINVGNNIEVLLFSLFAAYHAREKDIPSTLKLASMIVIVTVIIYCITFPGSSMSQYGLHSFYKHKNHLGFAMGLCSLILIMAFEKKVSNYIFLALSIVLLLLSQSKTPLNLLIVISVLTLLMKTIKVGYEHLTLYTQGLIKILAKTIPSFLYMLIGIVVWFREAIADYLIATIPYDALTGRGLIWVTVLARSRDNLLTGLGPGVFWDADRMSEIAQTSLYEQDWVKILHAADGGYIDIIGGIGFIGLALLLFSIIQTYQLLLKAKISSMHMSGLVFSLITFFVLHNFTESDVFRFLYAPWFIFQFLTFYLVFTQHKPEHFNQNSNKPF